MVNIYLSYIIKIHVDYITALKGYNYFFFGDWKKNVLFGLDLEQSLQVDSEGTFLVEGKLDQQKHGDMNVQDLSRNKV